jgi:esterase/lipase superfamily enzyme
MEYPPRMTHDANRRAFLASTTTLMALGLTACVPEVLSVGSVARPAVAPPPGYHPVLLAITNRQPAKGGLKSPWFGHERSGQKTLARVVLNRPDTSLIGRATLNGGWSIGSVQPESRPALEALTEAVSGREVLLYTHGYKESFETSAISAMELAQGTGFNGVPLLFTWPSRAALLDYGYDRESALFSRDAFEETLVALLSEGGASRVHIVAHSMGTLLTVETLRQMWARHGDLLQERMGALVLAAADIDFDLFENALKRLRTLVPKITVISSTSDRALAVSRRIAGGVTRTGAATREQLEGLGVRVVDASDHGGWALVKHDLFLSDDEVRQVVRRSIERGR